MMMNLLLDIDKVFSLVIQQEHELNSSISIELIESIIVALHVNAQHPSNGVEMFLTLGRGFNLLKELTRFSFIAKELITPWMYAS